MYGDKINILKRSIQIMLWTFSFYLFILIWLICMSRINHRTHFSCKKRHKDNLQRSRFTNVYYQPCSLAMYQTFLLSELALIFWIYAACLMIQAFE